MADAPINTNVGVNINPTGMEAAAGKIQDRVRAIAREIERAGQAANAQLKAMAIGMQQVNTLRNVRAQDTLGGFNNLQTLGRQARAFAEFQRGISKTSDAAGVLQGRVRQLNAEFGQLVQQGRTPSKQSLLRAENLDQAAQAYGRINSQVNGLRGRISLLGEDAKKSLQPMLANLDKIDKKNQALFSNGSRFSFSRQVEQYGRMSAELEKQVVSAEKSRRQEQLKLETLRQQAVELRNQTVLQREARLASAVSAADRRIRNDDVVSAVNGRGFYQRDTNQVNRLQRATRALVSTQARLNAELAKPAAQQNAARIQTLITRESQLVRLQGEALAMQRRLNRERERGSSSQPGGVGGFFAGMRTAPGNLFAEEGGGAYGAGQLVGRVGAYALAAGAIYGLISAIRDGVAFTIQFEDALAQLKAVSGSTETEMRRLSDSILSVSRNSANSILELTESATIIAQAGYAASEIEGLLQNVVNLSAASGSSASESVDILTSALGSFQLSASESTQVTDALVAALNDSKLSVNQVQLGLQYVGATARLNNITFNELVATLGAMADAGIRSGSTMSTGLRQMLVDFIDPTDKLIERLERVGLTTADIDVEVLGLTEVLQRLHDAGFEGYGALETRAAAAYAVLSNNIPQIERLEQATLRQNVAQDAAAERIDSVNAKWQRLLNTLGGLMAAIGENLTPLLKGLIDVLTILGSVILVPFVAISELIKVITTLGGGADEGRATVEEFARALENAGMSAEDAAAQAEEMAGSLGDVETALRDTEAAIDDLETEQASLRTETEKLILRQEEMAGENGNLTETTAEVANQVNILSNRFPGLRSEFEKTEGGIQGLITAMMNLDRQAQQTLRNLARTQLAQAELNKNEALAEGGRITARFRAEGPFSVYRAPLSAGRNSPIAPLARRFESLMRENTTASLREAQRLAQDNPELRNAFSDTYEDLTRMLSDYDESVDNMNLARQQFETSEFLLSETGQQITQGMTADTANSTRAASQGSSNGRSADQIRSDLNERLTWLDNLAEEYSDNPYVLGVIGSARSSTNAGIARLTPEPESASDVRSREAASRRAENAARRRERELDRINAQIQREEVDYREQLMDNAITAFELAPDLSEIPELLDDVGDKMREWLGGEAELAVDQIEAMNPTSEQRTQMLETAQRNIEQMRIEQVNELSALMARIIRDYIQRSTEIIERQYNDSLRELSVGVSNARGRSAGLNSPFSNNTPDYMRVIAQHEGDLAQLNLDRATISANETRIEEYRQLIGEARQERELVERQLETLGQQADAAETQEQITVIAERRELANQELARLDSELGNLEDQTRDLVDANEALKSSYEAINDAPRTFAEGLRGAATAAQIGLGAADNLGQELIKNLGQPLQAVGDSFRGFFTEVITGTETLGGAFENMAKRIIAAILEMVATAIATQFFSMFLDIIAPGSGSVFKTMGGFGGIKKVVKGGYTGGQVGLISNHGIKSMYGGGEVMGGLATRDSTLIHAAKEEYLIRRPAAQSLGKGFLDAINARGADALRGVGGTPVIANTAPPVETNVYVVAPDEKPSMGPNDVIATISNDVLRGGVTKKLIKKVVAGG